MDKIGSGGFGNVFKKDGKAIKYLSHMVRPREGIEHRFYREYEITKSLSHVPGVINVFEYGEDSTGLYYTMELCDKNLKDLIENNYTSLSKEKKDEYNLSIVTTMKEVHDLDILHRDLCPNNILIKEESIVISDFGLGKNLSEDYSRKTINTTSFGHYGYTAPEQLNSLKEATKQSDVYSLGKIINYIMTGDYDNDNHKFSIISKAATAQSEKVRYVDANELLSAIESILQKLKNTEFESKCLKDIENNIYNDDIKVYFLNMGAIETYNNFSIPNYRNILLTFLKREPTHAKELLEKLQTSMSNCRSFEAYDNYSYIMYTLLMEEESEHNIDTLFLAGEILKYIAVDVRRFNAQDKIRTLLDKEHVHPKIKEMLDDK